MIGHKQKSGTGAKRDLDFSKKPNNLSSAGRAVYLGSPAGLKAEGVVLS